MGFCNENDMLSHIRLADYLQRLPELGVEFIPPLQWLRLATAGGAQAIGLGDYWGTLKVGSKADLLLIDIRRMAEIGMEMTAIGQILLQYLSPEDIRTVIINGEVVMDGGRILTVDEPSLAASMKDEFKGLSEQFKARLPQMRELEPYVDAYFRGWNTERFPPAYQYNTR
jgi:5-methylthioadenosine/S-adenosylhomocysteine deaminase